MKLGMYIMAPQPVSTAYFLNPSHQSVYLYVYPPILVRQRFGKNVTATTTTHATIEELLYMSYQGKQAISSSQSFLFCYMTNNLLCVGCIQVTNARTRISSNDLLFHEDGNADIFVSH
jgi:hypothetical protein